MHHILKKWGCGNITIRPYVVLANGCEAAPDYSIGVNEKGGMVHMSAKSGAGFSDDLYFTCSDGEITARRVFENISETDLKISELGLELSGIDFGKNPRDDYFYHNENPRIYEAMTFPIDYNRTAEDAKDSEFDISAGNRWADPGVICERIGASPYQPFPAILLSNYYTKKGLVHGSLSQKIFYHNYLAYHEKGTVTLKIFSSLKATKYIELESGRVLTDEWYLGVHENADDIEKIFDGYTRALRAKLPVSYGRTDINRDSVIWGTWNDGIFRNVSEEMLIREAAFLKENFPTLRWIQLDDGYAVYNQDASGLGVPYEGDEGVDKSKFPNGLRYVTDKIRELGLRPAIWVGGKCPGGTKINSEHPEWFLDYSFRLDSGVLDVSIPEVRSYMQKAIQVLCERYGFEGVKHDFWSYAFEDRHDLYKNKDKSGYELRSWWLKTIRNALPSDGYLETGCDIAMGNPFLGEYATNYRYGIDIGTGNWDHVKTNYLWGVACFATHTGDLLVPNSDSIGLFPGLSETEAMFVINYCLVTHSMVEITGLLSQAKDEKRLKILKKAVCNPNNGQNVYFADYDYRKNHYCVPEVMYFKTPHFSRLENADILPLRTVGIFNVEDAEKEIGFSLAQIGLDSGEYILHDIWSGEQYDLKNSIAFQIKPHASRVLAVCRKATAVLLDANVRVNRADLNGDCLRLEMDYGAKNAEFHLSRPVRALYLNGQEISLTRENHAVRADLPEKGIVEVIL